MARKLSLLSVLAVVSAVIMLSPLEIKAQKQITANSIAHLNSILAIQAGLPANQTLLAGDTVTFTQNDSGPLANTNIVVSNEAMTGTGNGLAYDLRIIKSGAGTWRLDQVSVFDDDGTTVIGKAANVNALTAGRSNYFNVTGGTLELMQGTTLTLAGAAAETQLNLSAGTTLNARAGNVITAPNIRLGNGVSIGLDLTNENGATVLTLAGNVTLTNATNQGNINLLGFKNDTIGRTIQLLQFNYAGAAPAQGETPTYAAPPIRTVDMSGVSGKSDTYGENFQLLVRGENWADVVAQSNGRLTGTLFQPDPLAANAGTVMITIQNFTSTIRQSTWNGNENNEWNATSHNWQGVGAGTTFLHGDSVLFRTSGPHTITVQAGGVQINNSNWAGFDNRSAGMIVDRGEYRFENTGTSLIGIDGPGNVYITSATTNPTEVTFVSPNSYWGTTTVDKKSSLILENSAGVGTGTVILNDKETKLTFATALPDDNFYNSISTEAETEIHKINANILTIFGAVRGNANTFVEAGTLRKNIGQGILTVYKDATYDTAGDDRSIAGLSDPNFEPNPGGADAVVKMGSKSLYINVANGYEYVFSGQIQGTGAKVIKYGPGTQVFENADNTYTGGTGVVEGKLVGRQVLSNDIVFHPFGYGTVDVAENALLQFHLLHDPLDLTTQKFVATVDNSITGKGGIELRGEDLLSALPDESTEILNLTGNSNYTGKTSINGSGKIRIGNINATGQTNEVAIAAGAALQFNIINPSAATPYDRIITGQGNVEVLENTNAYVQGFNNVQPDVFSSYTGNTIVEQGSELHLLDVKATGETDIVNLTTATSNLYLDFASKTDTDGHEMEQVYDRYISGDGNLFKTDTGTTVLQKGSNSNDYLGETWVNSGTLKLNYAAATGAVDVYDNQSVNIANGGILELAFNGDYEKGITGNGSLAKSEAGTITYLQGKSTYTGGTYIYSGTLSYSSLDAGDPGNLGTGGVEFQRGGGTLQNRNPVIAFDQKITIYGGSTATFDTPANLTVTGIDGIVHQAVNPADPYYDPDDQASHFVKIGAGTMTINTTAGWTGLTTVKDGILANNIPFDTVLTVESPGVYHTGNSDRQVSLLLGDGTVETVAGKNFIVNNAKEDTFDGIINGYGNLVKRNKGTLRLTNTNTYSGSTLVESGTLIGGISSGTDLTVLSGIYKSGGTTRLIGSLQGNGTVDMEGASLIIQQDRLGFNPVYSGVINNGKQLTKTGTGSQTLTGLNYHFSDNILINKGTLQVGGVPSVIVTQLTTNKNLTIREDATLFLGNLATINVKENLDIDGTLIVSLDHNSIWAGSVTIGNDAVLDVRGIGANDEQVVIIHSETPIEDNFKGENVKVAGQNAGVDFLYLGVSKSEDKRDIYVGQTLSWYAPVNAHGNFTLTDADSDYAVNLELKDVTGTFKPADWDGKTLTKKGLGTLILTKANSYTGATNVEDGTLKLTNEQATAGSEKIVLKTDQTLLALDFDSRDADGYWTNGLTTPITGAGGVVKTGYSTISVLGGTNTYTGDTDVQQGALLVDGSLRSHVWVREDAGFGGNGTIFENVNFRKDSYYYWRFGATEAQSDTLTVTDKVYIGENVNFKPVTFMSKDRLNSFDNWVVLKYGELYGRFAGIDASANPFFDFNLDYDQHGVVKLSGYLRNEPHALSDIVPTSLMMAQTKMYRTAFQQITREWESNYPQYLRAAQNQQTRGQVSQSSRSAWMSFVGRGDDFESMFFKDKYNLQSYGVQAGISLISNSTQNFGFLFGREEGKLSNNSDRVKDEDYYLGFYYGQKFYDDHDFRAYIGGGWQSNDLLRTSSGQRYEADYNGNTFNLNFEIGRRFYGQNDWSVRLLSGFDVEVRRLGGATENPLDADEYNLYRSYNRSSLTRTFIRAGIEANKAWRRIDFRAGTQLGYNFGDTRPKTTIYYPEYEGVYTRADVVGNGTHLGRFEWWLNVGMDWYLTDRRNTFFFLDYNGDVYLDRDGNTSAGTGSLGFCWRF